MARALDEPIPVQPFLDWVDRRARILAIRYDDGHKSGAHVGLEEVLDDIGWDRKAGVRRLHRWRNGGTQGHSGMAERAVVEDALWRAGVGFWEIYPEIAALDDEAAA